MHGGLDTSCGHKGDCNQWEAEAMKKMLRWGCKKLPYCLTNDTEPIQISPSKMRLIEFFYLFTSHDQDLAVLQL